MANKKVSQLTSKPSVLNTDIIPIADPTSGQLFKTTLSALGAVIGSAVASVNGLVGVVVLDTDDIQELASPTNRWFTDTRARAALSGGTGISYNSGTGVITSSVTLADLGGVPTSRTLTINGTAFDLSANRSWSIDSMVYPGAGIPISTGSAWGTSIANNSGNWNTAFSWGNHAGLYLPIGGGTLTGALNGTSASFSGRITANYSSAENWAGVFYNESATGYGIIVRGGSTSSQNALLVQNYNGSSTLFNVLGNGESSFSGNVTANSFVKSGGTSSQFLKADGSVDIRTFATTGNLADYLPLTGGALLNNPSSAYVLTVTNNSTASGANGLNVSIATGSTGMPFKVDKGGVSLFTVDNLGASVLKSTITAISFIKSSGTSSEFLKADGSVDSNTYVSSSALSAYLPLTGGTLTGALSGTTISTSGSATFGSDVFTNVNGGIFFNGPANYTSGIFQNASGLNLQTGGSPKLTVTSGGNVGIGTSTFPVFSSSQQMTMKGASSNTNSVFQVQSFDAGSSLTIFSGAGASDDPAIIFQKNLRFGSATNTGLGGYSERMRITSGGNVLIGTTTVLASVFSLQVGNGTADTRALFNSSSPYSIALANGASSLWYIGVNAATAVNGLQFYSNQLTGAAMTITTAGNLTCVGSVTATGFFESSDSRLKAIIEDNYQAKGIESVTAKLYTKNGITELGYYAQDVQAILPSAVTTGADGFLNLSYREVHTAKIARLEKRVEELEEQLNLI